MRDVSFIMKKALMFAFALALTSLLPLPGNLHTRDAVIAHASEVKSEKTEKTSEARLTYTTVKLVVDGTRNLSVRNLDRDADETAVFKSADTDVATVELDSDSKAVITAVGVGDTVITVTVKDAKKKTLKVLKCNVTVGPPAQSVKFTESEIKMSLSDDSTATILKAILKPGNTEEKPKITVSKDGVVQASGEASVTNGIATITVKALEPGAVVLTISIENGITDTCTIEVTE